MVVFGSSAEMKLLACASFIPSKQAQRLLAKLEVGASKFPVVMSRQLLLPPDVMPGIDFFTETELEEIKSIQVTLEADKAKQIRPDFPGDPIINGYPPSRSQCGESIDVVSKPGLMIEVSKIPSSYQSIMELILHLNQELSTHGAERVYLAKPQAYDWLNQRNLGVARLILTHGISIEEFILFMSTDPGMDVSAARTLDTWDVSMFVHVLLQRYPLTFVGASPIGVFLCRKTEDSIDLESLNQDITKLRPSGISMKDTGLSIQPVYILFG